MQYVKWSGPRQTCNAKQSYNQPMSRRTGIYSSPSVEEANMWTQMAINKLLTQDCFHRTSCLVSKQATAYVLEEQEGFSLKTVL